MSILTMVWMLELEIKKKSHSLHKFVWRASFVKPSFEKKKFANFTQEGGGDPSMPFFLYELFFLVSWGTTRGQSWYK